MYVYIREGWFHSFGVWWVLFGPGVWVCGWLGRLAFEGSGLLSVFYICLGGPNVCEVLLLEQINILKRKKEKKEK